MTKYLTCIGVILLFTGILSAQPMQSLKKSPSDWFNDFQKFSGETPNADSAFYCAQQLASDHRFIPSLKVLLHNTFAQQFPQPGHNDLADSARIKRRRVLGLEILNKMINDTTQALIEIIHPLFLLTKIQDNQNNPAALKSLTDEFIKTEIEGKDLYKNRSARYGLMISEVIGLHQELAPLNGKLLGMITAELKTNQISAEDASDRIRQDKRAWYRYLYAYVNYAQSEKTIDTAQKEIYLKTAFDFSPDLIDKNHQSAYFYDMILITGKSNKSFQDEYLDFITKNSKNRSQVLSILVKIALVDTDYKDELESYYNGSSGRKSFATYWSELINNGAPDAHPVLLGTMDNRSFSSKSHAGKWILVDFWGTWCGPCREEHPDMQKFYDSTVVRNPDRLTLMTIACMDQPERVSAYMKEKNFSFPVAMSDQRIEKTYAVQGYPTKILITPQGKYVTVPFGIDWEDFVRKYSGLD